MSEILVTTNDLNGVYKIIGPVFFYLTNKGLFSSQFDKLSKQYKALIEDLKKGGNVSDNDIPWTNLIGDFMATQTDIDLAFVIAIEELKKRASNLGGNAIVGFKFDLDFNTKSANEFFVKVTGTAVRTDPPQSSI
jgi:hypothetical protein